MKQAGLTLDRYLDYAVETGEPLRVIGGHGIGKTAATVHRLREEHGLDVIVLSLAYASPEDLGVPVPVFPDGGEPSLELLLYERFRRPGPKAVVLDDFSRGDRRTLNAVMELVGEGSVSGMPVTDLAAVVALDNAGRGDYDVNLLDPAQAARFVTVAVTEDDIGWRAALRARHAPKGLDKLFRWRDTTLDPAVRAALPPRVLDHMVSLASVDLPVQWALPLDRNGRRTVPDANGADVSTKVVADIASALGGRRRPRTDTPLAAQALAAAFEAGLNVRLVGHQGIGKTSFTKSAAGAAGLEVVYLSLAQASPEDLGVPVPRTGADGPRRLEFLVWERFLRESRFVLVLDEFSRGDKRTLNAAMELINERTLGGIPIPGLVAVVALDNPPEDKHGYDVGLPDPAQATRFAATVPVGAGDIPWDGYLAGAHGEAAAPFVRWWKGELDGAERVMCPPRTLERMIRLHGSCLDMETAFPVIDGERRGVPLAKLKAALRGSGPISLEDLAAAQDAWIDRLTAGEREAAAAVQRALLLADGSELKRLKKSVVRLAGALPLQERVSLMTGASSPAYWQELFAEMAR